VPYWAEKERWVKIISIHFSAQTIVTLKAAAVVNNRIIHKVAVAWRQSLIPHVKHYSSTVQLDNGNTCLNPSEDTTHLPLYHLHISTSKAHANKNARVLNLA
jgi:hypothetical protein